MEPSKKVFFAKLNNSKLYIFYAMVLTAITYLLTLTYLKVLGYGNNTILQSDLAGQYISFLQMFKRLLQGQGSLWYTFSEYLGSGAILTYAYYTFNPFNLLFLIPNVSPSIIILIIIILKITLIAGTMEFFLQKGLHLSSPVTILFSMCFALNGFVATLGYNLMWLDAIYMTPVLIYLIMRFVDTGKWLALVPAYAYLFLTNFYMAYIVGVFSAFVFILYYFYKLNIKLDKKTIRKRTVRRFSQFAGAVTLAAGTCATFLLPCAFFLFRHSADDNMDFKSLSSFIPETINALFIGQSGSLDNTIPFLYAGLPVLILVPFYFINKHRSLKEKIYVGTLLIIYFFAMTFLPFYKFMHAFDYPNFYAFRFSYLIIFVLVAIAAKEFEESAFEHFSSLAYYLVALITLYSSLIPIKAIFRGSEKVNSSYLLCLNGILLFVWAAILFFKNRTEKKLLMFALSTLLLIGELSYNGYLCEFSGANLCPEESYKDWFYDEKAAVLSVKPSDNEFYRILIANDLEYNSACAFDVASFNTFSSSDDYNLRMLLKNLGYATCNRALESAGSTPVTNMLFGTKYIVSIPDENVEVSSCTIEEIPQTLALGYMVNAKAATYKSTTNPFYNQINLLYCFTGKKHNLYEDAQNLEHFGENIDLIEAGSKNIFHRISYAEPEGRYYYFVPHDDNKIFMSVFPVEKPIYYSASPIQQGIDQGTNRFVYISQGNITTAKTITVNEDISFDRIAIAFYEETDDYSFEESYFVTYNKDSILEPYQDLSANQLDISIFSDDHIEGTVTATPDKPILFLSIPYDKCWHATVDGVSVPVYPVLEDAFCCLVLEEGEHNIVLDYEAEGASEGFYISIASLAIFLTVLMFNIAKRKHEKVSK